jgi:hypothetical protein
MTRVGGALRLALADPRGAALSARMAVWLVLVSALARVLPLPRAHRLVAARVRRAPSDPAAVAARLAASIDRVLRLDVFVFRRSCWRRALVLHRFLALHGLESRVMFGVKKSDPTQGHAWLERDGQPFLESDAGAYVVTFSLPHTAPWESCRPE